MKLTWREARAGVSELASDLRDLEQWEDIQYILVGRGGLQVGALLARYIKMKWIYYVPISRDTLNAKYWAFMLNLNPNLPVVAVDDIYDTGATLHAVVNEIAVELGDYRSHPIRCIALCSRFGRGKEIHLRHWKTLLSDDWVEFPWEEEDTNDEQLAIPF